MYSAVISMLLQGIPGYAGLASKDLTKTQLPLILITNPNAPLTEYA
jgi:hypothetical protein